MFNLIEACQEKGIACIVELDDDLMATHKNNIAYDALNPKTNDVSNWNWLKACCDKADLVTVSTPNLAHRYAPHGRVKVLRNCIPEDEFKREKTPAELLRLGWTGTVQTHPEDLMVVGGQINAALNGSLGDPGFYVVGDGEDVSRALSLTEHNPVHATGWVERDKYFAEVNSHIDVGIVPLTIDTFNTSKSYLKSLEFASQGIPSVVSATDENRYLSNITGNPVVHKPKDWQRYLKPLLSDKDFWLERSAAVRESVRPLTYENHAEDWIIAWNRALENRTLKKFF
jgi:glycosyltransferase involved in cell wall biosynthesis